MDMATLNTRVGWASNANSSIGWFRDNSKPIYRTYGLENMAGYYWYQSNICGSGWTTWNCNGTILAGEGNYGGTGNCHTATRTIAGPQCCQDGGAAMANCNCNCVNACQNCQYSILGLAKPYAYPGTNCDANYQCAQCDLSGNCDSRNWMQPNCNCVQCNCACNCYGAGQCVVNDCNCACG